MKRLLALIGITFLSALTAAFYFGETLSRYFVSVLLVLLMVLFLIPKARKNKSAIVATVVCLIAFSANFFYTGFVYTPIVKQYTEKEISLSAQLIEAPTKSYQSYYYTLKANTCDNKKADFKFLIKTTEDLCAEYGDIFTCTVTLKENDNDYSKASGVFLCADYAYEKFDCKITEPQNRPLMYYIINIRDRLEKSVASMLGDNDYSDLCNAMIWGDKYALDSEIRENFRVCGVSHVIVVSGMHLSVITSVCFILFRKLFKNRYVYVFLTASFVILFSAITGFSNSIMRAALMSLIMLSGQLFSRKADSLNSLGFSALCLTAANPYAVGDVGLLLSFGATLGIVLWAQKITNYCVLHYPLKHGKGLFKKCMAFVAVWLSASIFTTPILIIFFGSVSTLSFVANVLVVPFCDVLIVLMLIACLINICPIISFIAIPFAFVCKWLCIYILNVVKILSDVPYATVYTDKFYIYVWLLITFLIVVIKALFFKKKVSTFAVVSLSAIILVLGMCANSAYNYNKVSLEIYGVGKGVFVTLDCNGHTAVLSGGGEYRYKSMMLRDYERKGAKTDVMVWDFDNRRASSLCDDMLKEFDVDNLLIYNYNENDKADEIYLSKNRKMLKSEFEIEFSDESNVKLIPDSSNNVWQYVNVKGKTFLIVPKSADCLDIDSKYLTADGVILNEYPKNYELMRCDTLIISTDREEYLEMNETDISNEIVTTIDCEKIKYTY